MITHTMYITWKDITRLSDIWMFKAERRCRGVMIPLCVFGISSPENVCWSYPDTRAKVLSIPPPMIDGPYLFAFP